VNSTAALRGATVVLGDRAILRSCDLEIRPGVTVIRGPNGSGKTTLLRALAGLIPLSRGTREAPARTLYLGQRTGLLHGVSARDNLRFLASFRGGPADAVGPALASWGIAAKSATRPVETLSAGERRRAALARIDVERCDLVLLDEPFGEIDDDAATHLLRTIRRLAGERRSVVIATHGRFELDAGANDVVQLG
jgi:ABC-type multidrug transport system ATPase subunit